MVWWCHVLGIEDIEFFDHLYISIAWSHGLASATKIKSLEKDIRGIWGLIGQPNLNEIQLWIIIIHKFLNFMPDLSKANGKM